jgi:hypothetical protein
MSDLTPEAMAELERLAREATRKVPWTAENLLEISDCEEDDPRAWEIEGPELIESGDYAYFTEADAKWIVAASPAVVLALLERLRSAEETLAGTRTEMESREYRCPSCDCRVVMFVDDDLGGIVSLAEHASTCSDDGDDEGEYDAGLLDGCCHERRRLLGRLAELEVPGE